MLYHSNKAILELLNKSKKTVNEEHKGIIDDLISYYKSVPTQNPFLIKDASNRELAYVDRACSKIFYNIFESSISEELEELWVYLYFKDESFGTTDCKHPNLINRYYSLSIIIEDSLGLYNIGDVLSSAYISMMRQSDKMGQLKIITREFIKTKIESEMLCIKKIKTNILLHNKIEKEVLNNLKQIK